jgi:hypothetical protein
VLIPKSYSVLSSAGAPAVVSSAGAPVQRGSSVPESKSSSSSAGVPSQSGQVSAGVPKLQCMETLDASDGDDDDVQVLENVEEPPSEVVDLLSSSEDEGEQEDQGQTGQGHPKVSPGKVASKDRVGHGESSSGDLDVSFDRSGVGDKGQGQKGKGQCQSQGEHPSVTMEEGKEEEMLVEGLSPFEEDEERVRDVPEENTASSGLVSRDKIKSEAVQAADMMETNKTEWGESLDGEQNKTERSEENVGEEKNKKEQAEENSGGEKIKKEQYEENSIKEKHKTEHSKENSGGEQNKKEGKIKKERQESGSVLAAVKNADIGMTTEDGDDDAEASELDGVFVKYEPEFFAKSKNAEDAGTSLQSDPENRGAEASNVCLPSELVDPICIKQEKLDPQYHQQELRELAAHLSTAAGSDLERSSGDLGGISGISASVSMTTPAHAEMVDFGGDLDPGLLGNLEVSPLQDEQLKELGSWAADLSNLQLPGDVETRQRKSTITSKGVKRRKGQQQKKGAQQRMVVEEEEEDNEEEEDELRFKWEKTSHSCRCPRDEPNLVLTPCSILQTLMQERSNQVGCFFPPCYFSSSFFFYYFVCSH